jgi:hypothetical protein
MTPLDAELAHTNPAPWMLVIPAKLVVPHIEGRVMSLIIVVVKLDHGMSEHDSNTDIGARIASQASARDSQQDVANPPTDGGIEPVPARCLWFQLEPTKNDR